VNQTSEERIAAARARMAELRQKFIERTQGEVATLRGSFESLKGGESAALGVIVHLAHRMAGTGATLGLDALSDRAHELEKLGESQPPGAVAEPALSRIGTAIEALAAELGRTPRAG
jgi:HPt (histidine-containing phosphotransfer) domain-containing protein